MKKVLLSVLALILIAGITCAGYFYIEQKKIKEYSTYCMDEIRIQLGEYIGNVSNMYEGKNDNGYYLYSGNVSYEGTDYIYFCRVLDKDNVDVEIETEEIQSEETDNLNESEDDYNQFLEDIKSSGEQPQRINDYPEVESGILIN